MKMLLLKDSQVAILESAIAHLRSSLSKGACVDADFSKEQVEELWKELTTPTPPSRWLHRGEPDPHGERYKCERGDLIGGNLTDDEVANAMYLVPDITTTTIAKDRIRWLSRKLAEEQSRSTSSVDCSSPTDPNSSDRPTP